nr:hypothetical protein CFP56_32314 [Quercus suber]
MSLRNSELVQVLEPLLIAGFSSPHRGVVSDTIQFWNQKADHLQTLSYPPKLEAVLRARCVEADINLPEFPIYDGHSLIPELPAFYQIGDNFLHPSGSTRSSMRLFEERGKEIWLSHVKANGNIPVTSENNSGSLPKNPAPPTTKSRLRHEDSQIEFAPIESSPPGRDDEPQHLTEHQQERLAQQKHRAQMFPDLSSSPLPEPINRPNCISKRLDFTSDALSTNDDEAMGTPLALLDGHGIMSDDLPSSPTPSRSKEYSERAYLQNRSDEDDATDHIVDPPSSPPRSHDQVLDNHGLTTIDQDELGGNVDVANQHDDSTVVDVPVSLVGRQEERLHEEDVGVLENEDTYFPSDSILPSAQLQAEEQAAVAATASADETTGLIQDAGDVQPDRNDDVDVTATVSDLPEIPDELADTTRVEDSFGVTAAVEDVDHTDGQPLDVDRLSPDPDTDQTPRRSRKRKRTAGIVYTAKPAKKRKPQSPFKAVASFFSSYLSQSQEQEDEDDGIGDEIVVASSQPSYSPEKPIMSPLVVAEDKFDTDAIRSTEGPPAEIVEEASLHARQPLTTSALACLKRKASEFGSDTVDADGTIIDETSTGRTRSGRRRQIASRQSSIDGDTSSAKSTLRRLASVDIPRNEAVGMATSQSATREAAQAEKFNAPDAAVEANITSNLHNRKIATPKSIMSRIRNVIDDLRKSVLGEREASDLALMLCEVSNEIHEAKKRGIAG